MLAEKLNMTPEEAERWIVNLIRNARLDAKIDSKLVINHALLFMCTVRAVIKCCNQQDLQHLRVSRNRRPKTKDQRPRKGRPPRKRRPRKGRPQKQRPPRKQRPQMKTP